MDLEWTIRRRRIGQQDLLLIRELISTQGHRGRSYVSHRLCEIWDWRQDNGRFRQIACRHLLRQLEDKDNMGWSGWVEFCNLTPNDKTNLQQQR